MKKALMVLITKIIILLLLPINIFAQTNRDKNLDDMTKDELLMSLDLGKHAPLIKKFQNKEATRLINTKYSAKNNGCNVETMRNGEVIIVTIPTDMLFLPNDTILMSDCNNFLAPIMRYLTDDDMYRVILDVHTDDTGSIDYTDNLSLARVDAIFQWFFDNNANTNYLFPTASGSSDPLRGIENNSAENRSKNRRLEIYLVPGKRMLEAAKTGRIAF